MKKILFIIIAVLSLSACSKDDDSAPVLGAKVKVTVTNLLGPQKGVTVYMYKDKEVTDATKPSDAKKQVVTDQNGVAEFDLNLTELNILESQTSLYFAVFITVDGKSYVKGSTAITVKRNDTKEVTISTII